MLFKNVASQKIHIYAYDSTTGAAKTGDAANITGYVSLDGTANAIDDTNPAEVDATNMPGIYCFDLAQAETNCNSWAIYAKSSTANVRIEPIIGFTTAGAIPNAVAGANGGLPTTNGTKVNQTVDLSASQHVIVDSGTVTTLTNLPAVTTDWLTAAGVKADAVTKIQSGLATGTNLATVDTVVDAIKVKTDTIVAASVISDAVWDEVLSGHTTAGTTGAALSAAGSAGDPWSTAVPGAYGAGTAGYVLGTNLDAKVSSAGGGAGGISWTYTITDSISGLPIADVDVWVSTDLSGANIIASGKTNQYGVATFMLDAGTVYVWRQKTGVNFVNPDTEVVS